MRFVTITVAAALVAATAFVALAAQFGLTPANAGGSSAAIPRCDTNGFTISYGLSGANVNSVTVAGIADPGCEGASVAVTLTSTAGSNIGSGTAAVPTDAGTADNTVAVGISPTPAEAAVSGIQVALTGP